MTQPIVGYLIKTKDTLEGEPGIGYSYMLAGNGVFVQADHPLLFANVLVAQCVVRGLRDDGSWIELKHGKIPQALFDLALNTILTNKQKETYLAITWKDGYHLFLTPQEGSEAGVKYDCLNDTIMDIHSHPGEIGTHFSGTDNADELGFRLSLLVGYVKDVPAVAIRVGVYGYYYPLPWSDVFEGTLTGATDVLTYFESEVTDELQSELQIPDIRAAYNINRHWWDRFLGRGRPV